ncbi:DNA replication protein [Acinetobacter baumannii]|uniref:phage/plasmid replication protein, II/X family n=1 Tax=Acinetobacter baumannii TaxID=470 RepID=UPI000A33B684|nr:phage/plasmid replication protein, II/X family [Acinetobacter baumannii]OTL64146.1 DNA replication protein [Acinetobacter baumannii]
MIDFIEMRLFVLDEFVISDRDGKHFLLSCDLLQLGVTVGSRDVYLDEQGNMQVGALYHPYDDLPTSFTNVAFKLVHEGKIKPHVMIKCSPAKIMQGHNIFGSDNLELGVFEMLGFLAESHPKLYKILDIPNAQIVNLDVTYSARLRNDDQVCKVLDFLRKVSSGSLRKSKLVYGSTVYWGSPNSKRLCRKAYCKSIEFQLQLAKLKRQASKGEVFALRVIKYQSEHPNFLTDLWQLANKPLFEALEGHTMKALDHDTVFGKICAKFDTYTKSGRLSQTKSRNIFNFFCALELHGSDELKKKYSKSQYYQYISDLMSCGFSKAYLQNLDSESKNNVIPFVQLVKIDFQNQVPDWYQEPESRFAKVG